MSRCRACDANMNDFEATRAILREDGTKDYIDLCSKCYNESELADIEEINIVSRWDLLGVSDIYQEEEDAITKEYSE